MTAEARPNRPREPGTPASPIGGGDPFSPDKLPRPPWEGDPFADAGQQVPPPAAQPISAKPPHAKPVTKKVAPPRVAPAPVQAASAPASTPATTIAPAPAVQPIAAAPRQTEAPSTTAPRPVPDDDVVIRVRGLVNRFGRQVVHDGLDLDIRRGEILGVVGGSGTGKSVLLRTIIGLNRPARGSIEVLGINALSRNPEKRDQLISRWGVLFQDGALFSSLTVQQNVEMPLREHTRLPADAIEEVALLKILMTGLPADAAHKTPSQLSGGMRKRAGLARALALDPEILFLDEPTAGLDPIGAAAFDQLVRDLQFGLGLTVVMVTHDLDSLTAICDRIAVLVDKKILVGTLDELMHHQHPWIVDYFHGPRGRAAQEAAHRAAAG